MLEDFGGQKGHSEFGKAPPQSGGVSLLDLLLILLNRKWLIFIGTVVCGVASVIAVLCMTSYYTATAVVLPSQQKMGLPFGSLMGDLPMGGLMKSLDFLGQDDNSRFMSILASRRLAEKVISEFDLEQRYGFRKKKKYYFENVLKEYHKKIGAEEDDNGNILIAVEDSTPEMAVRIADYIADQLDSISYQLSEQSARGSRLFFEERLKLIRRDLDSVHRNFADFQMANNFIDLDAQVKSSIEAMAGVEAEVISNDIEKEMLASNFGSNSRMAEVKRKKEVLSRRLADYMAHGSGSLVLPLKKAPELGIQYANLYRDVKVQEGIYAFVLQLYEQAKFREANNSPVVTLLEKARAPQKRTSPKRMIFCLVMTLAGFSLLVTWVLLEHWYLAQKALRSETSVKLDRLFAHFRLRK
jgi:capsule polysaccharide export protein KpsE/RkpR